MVLNKKYIKLIKMFFAVGSTISLAKLGFISGGNILSILITLFIFIVYDKIIESNDYKNNKTLAIFLGVIYTILFILGNYVHKGLYLKEIIIWKIISVESIFYFISIFPMFYSIFIYILSKIKKIKIIKQSNISDKQIFIFSFLTIFSVWLLYFLTFFPGILSFDSIRQFEQIILPNNFPLTDWHPVFHTFYLKFFYKIGMKIFNNVNYAVATVTFVQMILMNLVFSYVILFLKNKKVSTGFLVLVILYYAFLPIFGYYSITLWKDVVFGVITVLVVLNCYNIIENFDSLKIKDYFIMIFLLLFWSLFRNNAIYVILVMLMFSLLFFKKHKLKFVGAFIFIIITYGLIKGPIFNKLNIKRTSNAEYMSIPLQQVARMSWMGANFESKDIPKLNRLMPIKHMAKNYDPSLSDYIKNANDFDIDYFNKHKKEYFMIYLRAILKNPSIAIDSHLASTIGYWYPNNEHWVYFDNIYPNILGITKNSKIKSKKIKNIIKNISSYKIPVISLYLRIAVYFWILLFMFVILINRRGIFYVYPYIPIFGIWLSLIIASPVFGEFRYIFGVVTSFPILIILTLKDLNKEKK